MIQCRLRVLQVSNHLRLELQWQLQVLHGSVGDVDLFLETSVLDVHLGNQQSDVAEHACVDNCAQRDKQSDEADLEL